MSNKILRIIDANINRASEGLRVIEEIARFILEDKKLTLIIKKMRSDIRRSAKKFNKTKLIASRQSQRDVGRKSYTASEKKRNNIISIGKANLKRVEEALRVLEEFSKLNNVSLGFFYKKIRFKLYSIEKAFLKNKLVLN